MPLLRPSDLHHRALITEESLMDRVPSACSKDLCLHPPLAILLEEEEQILPGNQERLRNCQ